MVCRPKGIRHTTMTCDTLRHPATRRAILFSPMPAKALRKPGQHLTATLAANLRAFRRVHGISQEELAELCDLHRTYIGSVERGERNVTLSTLEVLAQVVGVSVPALLTPTAHEPESDSI